LMASCLLAACSSLPLVDVPSTNHNSRINYLVIHFTSENFAESLRLLSTRTENPVSSHYLVPDPSDATYTRGAISVYRLVSEDRRAWHAGRSYWAEREGLNDQSIGVEIVNQSACIDNDPDTEESTPEDQTCNFIPYADDQIELLVELLQDILARNPDIDPVDVIGHADIAPTRRVDPGPLFPWQKLHEQGIGAWYDVETVGKYQTEFDREIPELADVQDALRTYGYQLESNGKLDVQTRFVVRALQMHFRPSNVTGDLDAETTAIVYALNEKYRSP
jgi:N-acetyl-anhydromuramyl-L-alanine amidase AmpD